MSTSLIQGGCHCGNIQFELEWPGDPSRITARECGCSFCQMRGGTWTSSPEARLDAVIKDDTKVTRYEFGTRTAEFYICAICGVVPFVTSEISGTTYAVVNVATFANNDSRAFDVSGTDFDGEDEESRLARRQKNWIGSVSVRN